MLTIVIPTMTLHLVKNSYSMMSFFLLQRREEEERVNCQNFRQNLSHVLKIEHTSPQVHSSMTYNFTMHCYPRNQQDCECSKLTCQVLATREQFLVLPDVTFAMLPTPNTPPSAITMTSSCGLGLLQFLAFLCALLCPNEFYSWDAGKALNKTILQLV